MKKLMIAAGMLGLIAVVGMSFSGEKTVYNKNGIKVYELKGSPDFPEAKLSLTSPANGSTLPEGKSTFKFAVENYTLGMQTPDADQTMCANSSKGQHIHFIMDNKPYKASYTTDIEDELKPGHHVLLAFLSRSYHESLKHKTSYILKEFNVGNAKDDFDENAPQIFYSRPKGEYIGDKETQKLMIDFYLVNCDLSAKGYKVRATVNGNQFTLTKWAPYVIEGLPLGEVKVKLELLDKNDQLVNCAYNGVERTATLRKEPATK